MTIKGSAAGSIGEDRRRLTTLKDQLAQAVWELEHVPVPHQPSLVTDTLPKARLALHTVEDQLARRCRRCQ